MKITFLPLGNENAPSSRIRAFTLHRTLVKNGISSFIGYNSLADVLFIQKRVDRELFRFALKARSEGKLVIYDVDDFGAALDYCCSPRYFKKIINLANIITTDTKEHLKYIVDNFKKNNVVVLPDSIDYYPETYARSKPVNDDQLRILWFGSVDNISLFEKYFAALLHIPNAKIVVATAANEELKCKYPQIEFIQWSLNGFIDTLQGCHLTCLMHDGSEIDKAKSNNKMITSIAWGVPAIVSNTPDYERTACESDVEYAVFKNEGELQEVIERLRSGEQRYEYLEAAQTKVWEKYSPATITNDFLKLVDNCMTSLKTPSVYTTIWHAAYKVKDKFTDFLNTLSCRESAEAGLNRDYLRDWVNIEGYAYRMRTFNRQSKDGEQPLKSNPTVDEIISVLHTYSPDNVLEIGCGWGRIMEGLIDEFKIEGCDVSDDMLGLCPSGLKVFHHDIALENLGFIQANMAKWDVIFTRGLMLYFMEVPTQMNIAMNNMLMMAAKKIIIWEWPDVCDAMRRICPSDKFEYHPIETVNE